MKTVRVVNKRNGTELAKEARIADTFSTRCRGLLGRQSFRSGEGLIIRPCRMVHMMFMQFPIDVLFCDTVNRVVAVQQNLRPWRFSAFYPQASFVIELPVGAARSIQIGDELAVS